MTARRSGGTEEVGDDWVDAARIAEEALEGSLDYDSDELREFLAADLVDVKASPGFKEALRRKLWSMVRLRYGKPTRPS